MKQFQMKDEDSFLPPSGAKSPSLKSKAKVPCLK